MNTKILPPQIEKYSKYDTKSSLTRLYHILNKFMEDGGVYSQDDLVFSASKLRDKEPRYIAELSGFTKSISLKDIISKINFTKKLKETATEFKCFRRFNCGIVKEKVSCIIIFADS